jgi:hypothetical protein
MKITKPAIDRKARAAKFAEGGSKGRQPPSGTVRLTVNIDRALHKKFKGEAVNREQTMGDMLEDWIRQHLGNGS